MVEQRKRERCRAERDADSREADTDRVWVPIETTVRIELHAGTRPRLIHGYGLQAIEIVEDFRPHMLPTFAIEDQTEKEAARLALVREGGKMWNGLTKLNERLAKFEFSAGSSPTIADAYVITVCYMFQAPSFLDGFPEDTFAPFPNIVALKNKFCALPPLAEYYKDAEGIRAHFACTN